MKKLVFLLCLAVGFCSCSDDLSLEEQFQEDITIIDQYLLDNNLTAETTASGLRYIVSNPGNNERAVFTSEVTAYYIGSLTNGDVFDSAVRGIDQVAKFNVNGVIPGFSEGLRLIGEGGSIRIILPSALGYGANPPRNSIISENEVLVFDIELETID